MPCFPRANPVLDAIPAGPRHLREPASVNENLKQTEQAGLNTAAQPELPGNNPNHRRHAVTSLIMLAAGALYFELALIRFTAAEVLYLGYFSNFMLITAFVGLGVGFLAAGRQMDLGRLLPFTLLFLFALVLVSKFDVDLLRNHFGLFFFGNVTGQAGAPAALLLVVLFLATAAFFAAVGARLGQAFAGFTPLKAYTWDVLGSLLGIGLFSIQSMVGSGPITWVITGTLLLGAGWIADARPGTRGTAAGLVVASMCVVLLLLSSRTGMPTQWSSYQKLTLAENDSGLRVVFANGIAHQFMHPAATAGATYYGEPYRQAAAAGLALDNVLVIGAGSGTDVAVALDFGARQVDAVEIDRGIVNWGRMFHPDQPYADARVQVYVTDGRKFLQNATQKYDLIVFALPDSLMRLSTLSNIRLESYLFTSEAFAAVRSRLKDGGLFVLYNQYRWPWLINKIAATAEQTFAAAPAIIAFGDTTVIAAGGAIRGAVIDRSGFERLPTDNWPFVYMQKPAIHWLYIGMIALFLGTSMLAVRVLAPAGTLGRPAFPFFFMGMAFLLLETKSLAFFSLLFGTTWLVNAMSFAGILCSVLAANLIIQHSRWRNRNLMFAGLFAGLALAYLLPAQVFLGLQSEPIRYGAGAALMFAPIFFANLVFSRSFMETEASASAFGWNLLGAVAGGGLEYLSLLTGYRDLLWIVGLCYLLVFLMVRSGPPPAAGQVPAGAPRVTD